MVKFNKNKIKILNKIAKKQSLSSPNASNKILKKKTNAEKKVSFQKEVLLKEAISGDGGLVKKVSLSDKILNEVFKKPSNKKPNKEEVQTQKPKVKAVEKRKKRLKTQVSDTKLLLNLMKKK